MAKIEKITQSENPLIGSNIKRLRIQHRLRNVDIVAKLQLAGIEISTSTFSKIENGTCNPSVDMLRALTEIFRCDYNAFFYRECKK